MEDSYVDPAATPSGPLPFDLVAEMTTFAHILFEHATDPKVLFLVIVIVNLQIRVKRMETQIKRWKIRRGDEQTWAEFARTIEQYMQKHTYRSPHVDQFFDAVLHLHHDHTPRPNLADLIRLTLEALERQAAGQAEDLHVDKLVDAALVALEPKDRLTSAYHPDREPHVDRFLKAAAERDVAGGPLDPRTTRLIDIARDALNRQASGKARGDHVTPLVEEALAAMEREAAVRDKTGPPGIDVRSDPARDERDASHDEPGSRPALP